jgi:putative restriction endonuclease
MRGYFGNTDYDWYRFLSSRELDEVNFWQPSGSRGFAAIEPGAPFFFKLKKPHYAVAGFGYFVRHSTLPAWLAWETFREANGAPDFVTMRDRIARYRSPTSEPLDPQVRIGCILIAQPVFFPRSEWIPQPEDWERNIVQGKTYDLRVGEGRRVWEACRTAAREAERWAGTELVASGLDRYGSPQLVQPRLGQGIFRVSVIEAYRRACAVTGEHSLPALEAAHIRPYSEGGEHRVSNGLLLRSDIHRLFDQGYVTVTPDYRFEVGRRLKDDFENGRSYYPLRGQKLSVPPNPKERPDPRLLDWHSTDRFLG